MVKCKLSRLLGDRRWTQSDLARRTGIRPASINALYHEVVEAIKFDHIDKICDALECKVEDLIEYIPNKKKGNKRNPSVPIE